MSTQKYPPTSTRVTNDGAASRSTVRKSYDFSYQRSRRNARRAEEEARKAKFDSLSLQQQIDSLIPGGSKRQRARLEAKQAKLQPVATKATKVNPVVPVDYVPSESAPVATKATKVKKVRKAAKS